MQYKCYGKLHIWGWTEFKEKISGKIVSYDTTGNIINFIIFEVEQPIDKKICAEFGVNCKRVI